MKRRPNTRWTRARLLAPRLERHPLGPRIFVLGLRWHEWHLGVLIVVILGLGLALGLVHGALPIVLVLVGAGWLIAKDWRDIFAHSRDTASWRLGFHRRPFPLRSSPATTPSCAAS